MHWPARRFSWWSTRMTAVWSVSDQSGAVLERATPLDMLANTTRLRRKPDGAVAAAPSRGGPNLVELAYRQYYDVKEA